MKRKASWNVRRMFRWTCRVGVGWSVAVMVGALAAAPALEIEREGTGVRVLFTGVLQSSTLPTGPWTDVAGVTSPARLETTEGRRFFRARAAGGLFGSGAVLGMRVTGPLQQHFGLAFAGVPDGFVPPVRMKPYFEGRVEVEGVDVVASLRVRGNSSLQECPFPKMKLKISKEARAGTPFEEAREVKIGTHCADGGRGTIGRLREQRAAFREALAYEVMASFGFVSPRVRRAQIEYRDTTAPREGLETGWVAVRHALVFEDVEVLAERLGGEPLSESELGGMKGESFEPATLLDLRLLHVLLGNWDYRVPSDAPGFWNTEVIRLADGRLLPVAGDFDLASWVTGTVRLSVPAGFLPELPALDRQMRYDLQTIQSSVTREAFGPALDRFGARRTEVEALVAAAVVDEEGRTNAARHLQAFFDAVGSVVRK